MAEELLRYSIHLKQESNNTQYNYSMSWQERQKKQEEIHNRFKLKFVDFANEVVRLGGVIDLGKRELQNERNIYKYYVDIYLPASAEAELRSHSLVSKIKRK